MSTCLLITAMISSLSCSSTAGEMSVRSWISTNCRRSFAVWALGASRRPNRRSKKLDMSASRARETRGQLLEKAPVVFQRHKRHFFAAQPAGDVAKGLARAALIVHGGGRAAVGAHQNPLVVGDHTDERDRQDIEHIV